MAGDGDSMDNNYYKSPSPFSSPEATFSVRIVDIDSYTSPPLPDLDVTYSDFSGEPVKRVPVIRVFGSTPAGQKTCLHVHGAFPYILVPSMEEKPSESYLRLFGESINHALQVSLGSGSKKDSHVFKISVVRGKPFYGYHATECVYLKIYLYNPSHIKRLADLLIIGAIMKVSLQPHESHIPFVLQFMIDNNLYGMNYLHSSDVVFRIGRDESLNLDRASTHHSTVFSDTNHSITPSTQVWQLDNKSSEWLLYETCVSTCELEGDVMVKDIMNREELKRTSGGFPGLLSLWDEERLRRERGGITDHLSPPPSPDRACTLIHSAEERHRELLSEIIALKSSKITSPLPPSSPPPFLSTLSQSCDPEFHSSQQDTDRFSILQDLDETPPIDTPTEVPPLLVDEGAIEHSQRLNRKLSSLSFNSTEAQFTEVLLDLLNPSPSPAPPSLSHSTSTNNTKTSHTNTNNIETIDWLLQRRSGSSLSQVSQEVATDPIHSPPSQKGVSPPVPLFSPSGSDELFSGNQVEGGEREEILKHDQSEEEAMEREEREERGGSMESDIPCHQESRSSDTQQGAADQAPPTSLDFLYLSPASTAREATPTISASQLSRRQLVRLCLEEEGEGESDDDDEYEMSQVITSETQEEGTDNQRPHPEVEFIPQLDGSVSKRKLSLSRKRKSKQKLKDNEQEQEEKNNNTTKQVEEDNSGEKQHLSAVTISSPPPSSSSSRSSKGSSRSRHSRKSLSLKKQKSSPPAHSSADNENPTYSSGSLGTPPLFGSREATPILSSPLLVERALSNSLVPKIRRLSREESEKYLSILRERTSLSPHTPVEEQKSSVVGGASWRSGGRGLKRKTDERDEINRCCKRHRFRSYCGNRGVVSKEEQELISTAIAQSLKTLKEEEMRREGKGKDGNKDGFHGDAIGTKKDEGREMETGDTEAEKQALLEEEEKMEEEEKQDHVMDSNTTSNMVIPGDTPSSPPSLITPAPPRSPSPPSLITPAPHSPSPPSLIASAPPRSPSPLSLITPAPHSPSPPSLITPASRSPSPPSLITPFPPHSPSLIPHSPSSVSSTISPVKYQYFSDTESSLDFTLAFSPSESDAVETAEEEEEERKREESGKIRIEEEEERMEEDLERGACTSVPVIGASPRVDEVIITPQGAAPSLSSVMRDETTPTASYIKPYWGNPHDAQPPQDYGGRKVSVPSLMPYSLPEFTTGPVAGSGWCSLDHWRTVLALHNDTGTQLPPHCLPQQPGEFYTAQKYQDDVKTRSQYCPKGPCIITPLKTPPSPLTVAKALTTHDVKLRTPSTDECSVLEGPSLDNTYGFQLTPTTDPETESEVQYITLMSLEVHVRTREGLRPDPEWDPVLAIFYYVHNDWPRSPSPPDSKCAGGCGLENSIKGVIAIDLSEPSNQVTTPTKKGKRGGGKGFKTNASPRKNFGSPSKILLGDQFKKSRTQTGDVTDDDRRPYLENTGFTSNATPVTYVSSEKNLFDELVKLVRRVDPDILLGYEAQKNSWGFLKSRGHFLGIDLIGQISRVPTATAKRVDGDKSGSSSGVKEAGPEEQKGAWFEERRASEIKVKGRIVLNVWRTLKYELSLTSYSFESVAYHVLYQRIPKFSYQTLTEWYDYRNRLYRSRVVDYYMTRCHGNVLLLEKFNLIGRTSELARLYGIEFYNVLARGTQYRVESMMLRLAKQYNYIAASPSIQQRARMAAPECLPLILEPESKFYTDPVLVLDFQSLYPSMVIAHNYCYSTCLGRVKNLANDGDYAFGACSLKVPDDVLVALQDSITVSPNGVVFVKPEVRRGVLPQMLEEILNTRIMVKQSMKLYKDNKVLQRRLDARQLGLKLIANVTYGYTGASYSGRMPCVEIADSIVRKGRETLERAIQLVESTPKWRARVVYGDTDSMFVLLKGMSIEEAFRIGREISAAVTADNPKPVKLKFEKVYLPCILQTKKRYAGYMYETLGQSEPVFEAKGIETVRRDNCPAVSKILEKSLKLLFSTKDVSLVKSYVQRQCCKILDGRISIQDFVFAKEYRGRSGYRPGACVAALELARQRTAVDRQAEPLVGERVPYVIVCGSPGLPLIKLVRSLDEITNSPSIRINSNYYITKQILPSLSRSFSLLGVDVFQWYNLLPRSHRSLTPPAIVGGAKKGTISQYFASVHCVICGTITSENPPVCLDCSKTPHRVAVSLSSRVRKTESNYLELCKLCSDCSGSVKSGHYLECVSLDCPIFYSRLTSIKRLDAAASSQKTLHDFLNKQTTVERRI